MLEALFADVHTRAVLVAATCNVACALVGCFLVLRRMSLMGDALSHSILPGLVIALLITQQGSHSADAEHGHAHATAESSDGLGGPGAMMLGALAAGIATTVLTRLAQKHGGVAADASLGVVYTSLFALGVVLIKQRLSDVHFDIACVYEGSLLQVAVDTVPIAGADVPRGLLSSGPVLVGLILVLAVLWKEWKITSFDPVLAATMGFAPGAMHYLLMILVSIVAMVSFESVGSILVVAMLIAPAAAAHQLVDRLSLMLPLAALLSIAATVLGYLGALQLDVTPAGCIAVAAGGLYVLAALLSPRYGVLSQLVQHLRLALRVRREDLLARLYRDREQQLTRPITFEAATAIAGGGWLGPRAVRSLVQRGEARVVEGAIALTDAGEDAGRRLVRSHRLWEAYLVEEVGLATDHVHDPAHRVEHFLDEQIGEEIERQLEAGEDPHGREIPGKGSSERRDLLDQ